MNHEMDFDKMGAALRSIGVGARFGIRLPDECIDRTIYSCELDCEGVPFGRVFGNGDTIENAFFQAVVRREQALADQKQAA